MGIGIAFWNGDSGVAPPPPSGPATGTWTFTNNTASGSGQINGCLVNGNMIPNTLTPNTFSLNPTQSGSITAPFGITVYNSGINSITLNTSSVPTSEYVEIKINGSLAANTLITGVSTTVNSITMATGDNVSIRVHP